MQENRQERRRLKEDLQNERQERRRLKRALEKQREQLSNVQKRNRVLSSRLQRLEQRMHAMEGSRTWKIAQSIGRARAAIAARAPGARTSSKPPDNPREGRVSQVAAPDGRRQRTSGSKSQEPRPPVGEVDFGDLRRVSPISDEFGFDRGRPVDRYYIEDFLERHSEDIRGRVLEIGDPAYTRRFGGRRVTASEVLHVSEGNPQATIVADLTRADHIPSDSFDCIIFTQTLQFIFAARRAVVTLHRILRPGGVLLATVPGISQIAPDRWGEQQYWAFTHLSVRRLFEPVFSASNVEVETHGNVLAAISFLHGLAVEELRTDELDRRDALYELLITVRAVKSPASA